MRFAPSHRDDAPESCASNEANALVNSAIGQNRGDFSGELDIGEDSPK
jgi:hypothetical protein